MRAPAGAPEGRSGAFLFVTLHAAPSAAPSAMPGSGPSPAAPDSSLAPIGRWLGLAALIIALDQAIKFWIVQNYPWGYSWPVTEFFNFVRVHNTGAAFSFLASQGGWQRWFFVVVAVAAAAFIVWQLRLHGRQKLFALALSLIMGGALGNALDRLFYGYVVDYLDFHWAQRHFPAFNLADVAITAGVAGMLLAEWLRWRAERRASA